MRALRWLLMLVRGVFGSAGALVAYDIYLSNSCDGFCREQDGQIRCGLKVRALGKPQRKDSRRDECFSRHAGQEFRLPNPVKPGTRSRKEEEDSGLGDRKAVR